MTARVTVVAIGSGFTTLRERVFTADTYAAVIGDAEDYMAELWRELSIVAIQVTATTLGPQPGTFAIRHLAHATTPEPGTKDTGWSVFLASGALRNHLSGESTAKLLDAP